MVRITKKNLCIICNESITLVFYIFSNGRFGSVLVHVSLCLFNLLRVENKRWQNWHKCSPRKWCTSIKWFIKPASAPRTSDFFSSPPVACKQCLHLIYLSGFFGQVFRQCLSRSFALVKDFLQPLHSSFPLFEWESLWSSAPPGERLTKLHNPHLRASSWIVLQWFRKPFWDV